MLDYYLFCWECDILFPEILAKMSHCPSFSFCFTLYFCKLTLFDSSSDFMVSAMYFTPSMALRTSGFLAMGDW